MYKSLIGGIMCNGYNNDGCKKKAGICYKGYVSSLEDGHKTVIYNDDQGYTYYLVYFIVMIKKEM